MRFLFLLWLVAATPLCAVDYVHDVLPLMSRFGCNGSACHGKAEGQNGFKISIFGADPAADHEAITRQSRGRRLMIAAPEHSLLLRKAAGEVPHAGGSRMKVGSREYAILRDWVAAGAPFSTEGRAEITSLIVEPAERVMAFGQTQPLRVTAVLSDGTEQDVTWLAQFQSNDNAVAEVTDRGEVTTGSAVGQAAVMAKYLGRIALFHAIVPRPGEAVTARAETYNELDEHVQAKLHKMNLQASAVADDATFLRRATLDLIGRLPTVDEARVFLKNTAPDKRARLVDALLEKPEFADFWALKWADLLRVDRLVLDHHAAHDYHAWIRSAVVENRPLDVFARDLITAQGPLDEQPAGYFFKVAKKPGEMASSLSQVFLGVRINCAECHQHPTDRWTQRDYHGMRAFFEQVSYKKAGGGEALIIQGNPQVKHPRTKEPVQPYALGTAMPETALEGDRRATLARWMTAPENPWFARNMANRLWAHFMGRGVVEPVDDFRATNPPSNPALLDALTQRLIEGKYDARALIRLITASRTYQLSATPNATNESDVQNFSRAVFRRLPAESLLDAVCDVTGVPEKFSGVPANTRAVELWDSQQQHYFLKLFGRPSRTTPCVCERSTGASISQALHLMNSPNLQNKLSHAGGRLTRLTAMSDAQIIEDLWLACFSRFPEEKERQEAMEHLSKRKDQRRQSIEDLAWSLMNTVEFVFNH